MSNANLDRILERVRKLIEMAEAPIAEGASPEERAHTIQEQRMARQRADALMFQYKIQEATARAAAPPDMRTPPDKLDIEIGGWGTEDEHELLGYFAMLSQSCAKHTGCLIRNYTKWSNRSAYSTVYGFESDRAYFNILYTTVRLHMVDLLIAKVDPNLSLEENCYRLHNAGYNWLDMGSLYGWHKYQYNGAETVGVQEPYKNEHTGEIWTKFQVGGKFKRAYYAACKAHGVTPQRISAGGTAAYRRSAAEGYTSMINRRLREMRGERVTTGADLVLKGGEQDLQAYFEKENPDLFIKAPAPAPGTQVTKKKVGRAPRIKTLSFDSRAYGIGQDHARSADLGGTRTGSGEKQREIG